MEEDMLESTIEKIWMSEFEDLTLFFECNVRAHFKIARGIKESVFGQLDQIKKTYEAIENNLVLALTSSNEYIGRFAELIYLTT